MLVKFRKFPNNDVIALFPDGNNFITSYMHIGQHATARKELVDSMAKATPAEYASLKAELIWIGYDL